MARKRPFGITLLAVLSLIAVVIAIWRVLQSLGIAPITLGTMSFFVPEASWVNAILWGLMALIYLWVFRMLWAVNPQGWLFVTVISILNLTIAVLDIIGGSSFDAMLPTLVINGIILLYCLVPGTKAAFEIP
ncbi:MAG: hypothetical protein JNL34_03640 [Anaerolineae bacterium]|nr:hypothetical protein [Anaerolineae bacterium]